MDLFDMAMEMTEKNILSIDDLLISNDIKKVDMVKVDMEKIYLIPPKKWKWIKFESNNERKILLKNYKHLGKKDIFKYNYEENKSLECTVVGYLECNDNLEYDHLVLDINGKLHVILKEYFIDMQ